MEIYVLYCEDEVMGATLSEEVADLWSEHHERWVESYTSLDTIGEAEKVYYGLDNEEE